MEYTIEYINGVVPIDAKQTEITAYMWPGFLAELIEDELTVWELCSPTVWRLRQDIMAPPANCIATTSFQALRWEQGQERWVGLPSGLRRVLHPQVQPQVVQAQQPVQKQQSLLSLCKPGKP